MVEAILIIAWRNDVGAYLYDSIPKNIEIDGQDLMNLYNLHRFRDTRANFQFIQTQEFRIASFYSGGYNNPYVGKPNYAVALLLSPGEIPDHFEKPLRVICNNLLIHLDDPDFDSYFYDIFSKIQAGKINEIKIERRAGAPSFEPKEIATTSTVGAKISFADEKKEEKDIFDDLLATVSEGDIESSTDDADVFDSSTSSGDIVDPFGGNIEHSSSTSSSDNPFEVAEDPFAKLSETAPIMKEEVKPTISPEKLIGEFENLQRKIPKPPTEKTPEKMIQYLEQKVAILERIISSLSKIAQQLQQKDKELKEKDELIGKLLLLLS
ncbi:MAG: hypothetical protein ACTSRZ_11485 [Promethearchaeota archaeon]